MENMKERKKGRPPKRSATKSTQVTDAYVNYAVEYYLAAVEECCIDDECGWEGACGYDEDCEYLEGEVTAPTPKPSLRLIAKELNISNTKLKKLLITGGVYDFGNPGSEETIRKILYYHSQGKPVSEICSLVRLKKSAVESCLPYEKIVYTTKKADWMDAEKRSLNAERCERYRRKKKEREKELQREREAAVSRIADFESLWAAIVLFAGYSFKTSKGLDFQYTVRGGEIFVDRKEKSITESSVRICYEKAVEMGGAVKGPKALGVFGASYLYPVFVRIGVIRLPEQMKPEQMKLLE